MPAGDSKRAGGKRPFACKHAPAPAGVWFETRTGSNPPEACRRRDRFPQCAIQNPQGLRELTIRSVILGGVITLLFTAANVYLGLKVGLTFATSIPAAVISMAVLKAFSMDLAEQRVGQPFGNQFIDHERQGEKRGEEVNRKR